MSLRDTTDAADAALTSLSAQDALVALMVAASVADQTIKTLELLSIERIINHLPVFAGYEDAHLPMISSMVFELIEEEEGLDALFGLVREALPERLYETAYALCCDVTAADGMLEESELRFLQEMRYELSIDRLYAAAIERGARARHMVL